MGRVPKEWKDKIFESLAVQGVPDHVITQSIELARIHGYDFGDIEIVRMFGRVGWVYKVVYVKESPVPTRSMGETEPMTPHDAQKLAAIYENRYNIAQLNDDYEAQASLLKSFLELVKRLVVAIMVGRGMRPGQDSNEQRRLKAGEQLRLPPGRGGTSGGTGGAGGGGGETEATNKTVEQLRPSAPQLSNDATKLARMGVRTPTARDVETRIAPSRPSDRRGGRSGRK